MIVAFAAGHLQNAISERRSVWFCYRTDTGLGFRTELPGMVDMMDMEDRILGNWEHYWRSAEDCWKTEKVSMRAVEDNTGIRMRGGISDGELVEFGKTSLNIWLQHD